MSVTEVSAKALYHTEKPPCCLRIFRDEIILLGTYDLDKPSGIRTGSIDVVDSELKPLKQYSTYGAVLDLKISPFDDTLLASAHSTGNVELWHIKCDIKEPQGIELEHLANLQIFDTDTLVTSLHFSPLNPGCVMVTATSGETRLLDLEYGSATFTSLGVYEHYSSVDLLSKEVNGKSVAVVETDTMPLAHEHALECWTAEFGSLSPFENVAFTGGDDSTIAAHDLRTNEAIWTNSRVHEAGVVAIKCSTQSFRTDRPTSIITGSYDDQIRSLDLRMLGDSIYPGSNIPAASVNSCNLGGGVWRLIESPLNNSANSVNDMLVCCMYNGAKVLNVEGDEFNVKQFTKKNHESMCYGGDWSSSLIATCSFYDKTVQIWDESDA